MRRVAVVRRLKTSYARTSHRVAAAPNCFNVLIARSTEFRAR